MDFAPSGKGKREAEDDIETEAATAKKQKFEENVCEIETRTVEIENKVVTSSDADEQLIEVESGANGHVVEVEDGSNVLEEDSGADAKKHVAVSKEGHLATAFENAGDSDSPLQEETNLDAAVTSSPSLMEDPSDPLKKNDEWSEGGPTSSSQGAAFLNENFTADNISSPAPSTKISLVSIQKKDDSTTREFGSAHETNKDNTVDTATETTEKKDESLSDDERSNKVRAVSIASFLTRQEDETKEKLADDDEASSSDDDLQTHPTTPTEHASGSKILFVGNLSFSIEQEDVEDFFKAAGDVVSIRFAMNSDETFKGYGYVEFASAEAAGKALQELNGKELLRRRVRLDSVRQRGSFTQYTGQGTASSQNGGTAQGQTVFVRGLNISDCEDEVKRSLEEHFGSCGQISWISVPKYRDGCVRGFAYVYFKDSGAFSRALALDGSKFKEGVLEVKEARPAGDTHDSAGSSRGYDSNGGRHNSQGLGGRSDGSNCRGRNGSSDFRGRSSGSDFRGRSGRSDFRGRSCGSGFSGRHSGADFRGRSFGSDFRERPGRSDFRERPGGSDFRERPGGSDFQGRGNGSDFCGRNGGSDFWGRGNGSNFRGRSGADFCGRGNVSDFRGRSGGSDFWGRGNVSNFHGRSGGSNFSGRSVGSEFSGRSVGSDFSGWRGGSNICGISGSSDFRGSWSDISRRSGGSHFHGRSGWSESRGRSGGSDFRGRSGGSEFHGRSGSSDYRGRLGGSDFCERSGGYGFQGRSSWSEMHGRGGQSDFGGRSNHEMGPRFGAGTWKHSNGRGAWRDVSARGILGSFHERNNVGGTGVGFEGDGSGQGTLIEPTIAAPSHSPAPAPSPSAAPAPLPSAAPAPSPSSAPSPSAAPALSPSSAPAPALSPSSAPAPAPSRSPAPAPAPAPSPSASPALSPSPVPAPPASASASASPGDDATSNNEDGKFEGEIK